MGEAAVQNPWMRASYVILNQISGALGTIIFVVKVSFFNRIAQSRPEAAGTVITFMASISNFGSTLPGTWAPLLVDAVGVDLTVAAWLRQFIFPLDSLNAFPHRTGGVLLECRI